jgi:hypothetical protein
MIHTRLLAAGIAVALSAGTVVLHGQQPQAPELVPYVPEVPSGPIAGWTFVPGVVVGAMYDSNVIVTTSLTPSGEPFSDSLYTIDPTGSLKYVGKRTSFDANYRGRIRRYVSLDALNGFDQQARVSLQRRATKRLTFYLQNQYGTTPTTDDQDLVGAPFRRAGSRRDTLAAGSTYRLREHTDWTVRYDFTWTSFDRPAPEITGGLTNSIQSQLTQRLTTRLRVGGEAAYRFAVMDVGPGRNLQFVDAGGNVTFDLGEFTTVAAGAGLSHLVDELNSISRSGPYFRASISHRTEHADIGAGYDRSFLPSYGFGGATRNEQMTAWISLPPIDRRLFIHGSTTWRRSNPFEALEVRRLDTVYLRGTVGYAVAREIRVQGFYVFSHQNQSVPGSLVNRHRAGVELVLFKPMRIP